MSCFANYYDPDRLKPLHNIVNKVPFTLYKQSASCISVEDNLGFEVCST